MAKHAWSLDNMDTLVHGENVYKSVYYGEQIQITYRWISIQERGTCLRTNGILRFFTPHLTSSLPLWVDKDDIIHQRLCAIVVSTMFIILNYWTRYNFSLSLI